MQWENAKNLIKEVDEKLLNIRDISEFETLHLEYLGKKGYLREYFNSILELNSEDKKKAGMHLNEIKNSLEEKFNDKKESLNNINTKDTLHDFKKSLPGKMPDIGHTHLISQTIDEIVEVFKPLGFSRVRYPEVEWDYYAFEALNMPQTHPARDEWETFFIDAPTHEKYGKMVLTPHTSSGQVREMLKGNLPIRMLNISRCSRRQEDISHTTTFHQFEGLLVDKDISITHLKGVLTYFAKKFFGPEREIRLRPYDFRFTEPSFEIDIMCGLCKGKGCRMCKEGWLELGGAGMVHPNVLKYGGIDSNIYTGFAFGWGVERVAMMKPGRNIDDIRYLYQNNLKFLEQF